MSSPASYSPSSTHSQNSPRVSMGMSSSSSRALAVVTNRWYREQRRADQDATRTLTLLKQRKISCILKVESLQRGIGRDAEGVPEVERELEEVERKMSDLERDREERCRKIMDRRVQQVTTLQELGLLEAAGKDARWRSESDLKEGDGQRSSPALSGYSPSLLARYSPGASSSSSHASRKHTPPLLGARLRAGSDPSIARPDPTTRLEPGIEDKTGKGLAAKLSPRLGRRNPLRMLSNAIDFRSRRKQRPKSADFEVVDDGDGGGANQSSTRVPVTPRSASVTDILESVSLSPGPPSTNPTTLPPRVLEGRNSAPDMLPGHHHGDHPHTTRNPRTRSRLSAAASAKQKLSTRFQPQRKQQHRAVQANTSNSSVKRAKTFSLGGVGPGLVQTNYKTLPKQASSRSLGSSSTDSSQGSMSTASSRKSSNSSNISDSSAGSNNRNEISQTALEEIAAFEKFIEEYFESCDNNNIPNKPAKPLGNKMKQKLSASSVLSEVLELSI